MKINLKFFTLSIGVILCLSSYKGFQKYTSNSNSLICENNAPIIHYPEEKHFKNVQQLTFGGDNAEAYFSTDNNKLVLQRTNPKEGLDCDQIFYGYLPKNSNDKFELKLLSTGKGKTTCSFFMQKNKSIVYASTHLKQQECPPPPDIKKLGKYLWSLDPNFEIFFSDLNGKILNQITDNQFYDAEATISPNGKKMVFTSTRSGDMELYVMDIKTKKIKQVTNELGYDGGAFFSPNSKQLVYRASRPKTDTEIKEYKSLLSENLVAPSNMEIYTCNIDGSNKKQITNLGGANWAPYFHPGGKKIIFCSNHKAKKGYPFNLYMVNLDGSNLEQITFDPMFDAFPMFSYDGKKIAFSSNRNNGGSRETNVFVADWVE